LLLPIKSEEDRSTSDDESDQFSLAQVIMGFQIIWNKTQLRWLIIIEGVRSLVEGISTPLLVLYVARVLLSTESIYAWSRMISSACAILASLVYLKFKAQISIQRFVTIGTILLIVSMLLISGIPVKQVFFIASALLGLGMAFRQLVSENTLIQVTESNELAEVATAFNAMISSFYLVGYGISLLEQKGFSVIYFFALSAFLLIVGSFFSRPNSLRME
jgi:Na+/melibiose symporter-like transporter